MNRNLTIREGILLLLALFGLIIGGATFFTVRYVRNSFVEDEYHDALNDLAILGRQIEKDMSDNEKGEIGDPFRFLQTAAAVQAKDENFSYLVRDSEGIVLAPAFAAGKPLPMTRVRPLTPDGGAFVADVWGCECFVVLYPFPNRPLELVAVYDNRYVFQNIYDTLRLFIILIVVIYLILVLLSWLWIIPALERTLESKQRVESELNAACKLQQKAVTKVFPADPRFDMFAVLQPAREVGGDIYRCGEKGGKLFFTIGDVSDKGTPAALLMFTISSYIHSRARSGLSSCEMMKELNNLICDNPEYEMFCTLFGGTINLETREMEYCNAGHTKAIVDGAFLDQDPQLIAGIVRDYPYHTQTCQLHPGSRLLLYTDGVTEARNEARAFYGEQRLLAWMRQRPAEEPASVTCEALLDELASFRGTADQNDDIAIMCIKI